MLLSNIGGGATVLPPVDGAWFNPDTGRLIKEKIILAYTYVQPSRFIGSLPRVRAFLHRMGRQTRQGEVVAAGTPIVTITDHTQTWIYAPLPETQGDAVKVGDSLRVVMPSGKTIYGKVINKATEADFATQRDVSSRKRDIKTIQLKLLIENPALEFVPGMTAEVYIPKDKLVKQ